jgi:hypothetical protein
MTLARCKLIPDLYLDESGSHPILHGACSRVQEPQFDSLRKTYAAVGQ